MPDSRPASALPRPLLIVAACAAAYTLFWLVGRPLLPASVQADRTVGLLPTLVVTVSSIGLLRHDPRSPWLAFGGLTAALAMYTVLMRMIF